MKPFNDLLEKRFSPEQRERIEQAAREKIGAVRLQQLREKLGHKQEDMAEKLGLSQSGVSRIEARKNLSVRTLQRYVEAMGGRLEVRAVFEDTEVQISSE